MKRIYLLAILIVIAISASAQQATIVFGNLGVENVNISIANTQYGTSTDAKGRCELPFYDP